jgi:hypothetical protein
MDSDSLVPGGTSTGRMLQHPPRCPRPIEVDGDTLTVPVFNKKIEGQQVVVSRRGGATFSAEVIAIRDDSCMFLASDGVGRQVVDTREIARLERNDRLAGGFNGFLFGGAGGYLLGAGIGSLKMGHGEMAGLGPAIAATTGAVVGAIAGTVFGIVNGDCYYYEFAVDAARLRGKGGSTNTAKGKSEGHSYEHQTPSIGR